MPRDQYDARQRLLAAAASWMGSYHYLEAAHPGPHDDAEMELKDECLEQAAREFVAVLPVQDPTT